MAYSPYNHTQTGSFLIFVAVAVASFVAFLGIPRVCEEGLWAKSPKATVNAWLAEQQKGRSGREYWATSPDMFYAVRSWEIVDTQVIGSFAEVTVRIESSTKGGQPIVKLWEVRLNGDAKIYDVDEKI
ncbi:MAG: hypothetical protein ABIP48_23045 [Planctomycetota bacterium]